MTHVKFDRIIMADSEDFDSKFNEIISNEKFGKNDLDKDIINEISDTLASISFLSAQLSHILYEAITSKEVEISASFMELLGKVKDISDLFNDEIEIEINLEEDEDDYEEEQEED
jgi:hypothetical protein